MFSFSKSFVAALALFALFAFAPVAGYGQKPQPTPAPGPSSVNVVNTPNVNVVNTPSVNVTSLPSVTLAPDSKVGIDPASNTVKVAPGGEMFFHRLDFSGGAVGISSDEYTVPEGKRLVLEHVSAQARLNSGDRLTSMALALLRPNGVTLGSHYLPTPAGVSNQPIGDDVVFNISQPLRMYLDAGYKFMCQAVRNTSLSGNSNVSCTVSGYLVDAQ